MINYVPERVENIVGKGKNASYQHFLLFSQCFQKPFCPMLLKPGCLSGECDGLMTWWLWVRYPVEANFLSGVFSPLTSAETCEESSRWL